MSWFLKTITFWKDVGGTDMGVSKSMISGDVMDKESWINYKTILFAGVVLFGTGYVLKGFASVVNEIDEATD